MIATVVVGIAALAALLLLRYRTEWVAVQMATIARRRDNRKRGQIQ